MSTPDAQPARPPEELAEAAALAARGPADRHPDDGWRLAEPWPLGRGSLRALRGLVRALIPAPDGGGGGAGAADAAGQPAPCDAALVERVVLQIRRNLRYMSPVAGHGLVALVWLLDWSPLWRLRGLRPLHRLAPARAAAALDALGRSRWSPLRTALTAARAAALTVYFDQPEVHAAIGYAPAAHIADRLALRARLLAGGAASGRDAPLPPDFALAPPEAP
jgi:hypothetical protein